MAPDYAVATLDPEVSNPSVSFTAVSQTVDEGAGSVTITAELSAASVYEVIIPFAVTGTATEGADADFTISSSPITIPSGELSASITVIINDDSEPESDETVVVTMWTPTNAIRGAPFEHTVTIRDNDMESLPTVEFVSAGQSVPEDIGTVTVTVRLSEPSDSTVTVPFSIDADAGTATAGADADFTVSASPLTIEAGQTSASLVVTVNDDDVDEYDETIVIVLGTPDGAELGSVCVHTVTIADNDPTPPGDFNVDNDPDGSRTFRDVVFCYRRWDPEITQTIPAGVALPEGEDESTINARVDELLDVVQPDGFRGLDMDMDGVVDLRDFTFINRRRMMHHQTVPAEMTLPDGVTEADVNARIDGLLASE